MSWRWWMPTKSPAGEKADAEDEPVALRGILPLRALYFGGSGRSEQTNGQGTLALWRLRIRLLHSRAVWNRLVDVFRPRVSREIRTGANACITHWRSSFFTISPF